MLYDRIAKFTIPHWPSYCFGFRPGGKAAHITWLLRQIAEKANGWNCTVTCMRADVFKAFDQ
eukprot:4954946-Alexandrium_andersonii.AAC.1